jgi:hypothetical protein
VVRAVTIAMQQLSKQTLNNGATLFPWGLCRGVILKTIVATVQFVGGDRHGKFSAGARHAEFSGGDSLKKWIRGVGSRREFRSVKVLFEVCYEDYEGMEYWRIRL